MTNTATEDNITQAAEATGCKDDFVCHVSDTVESRSHASQIVDPASSSENSVIVKTHGDDTPNCSKPSSDNPPKDIFAPLNVNTDGRDKGKWESRYCNEAKKEIRIEAFLVGFVFICTLVFLFLTWNGWLFSSLTDGCNTCSHKTFNKYAYFFLGGLLGGVMFAVKYLYKVVSHGYWHLDRRLWRIFSPFLSGGLALALGAMLDSGILGLTTKTNSGSGYLSVGFIAGYFADSALAKMQEVADTVFGATKRS